MASFLGSVATAAGEGLDSYLTLVRQDEHLKRQESLQAKREANVQSRWQAQFDQQTDHNKTLLVHKDKQFEQQAEQNKALLKQKDAAFEETQTANQHRRKMDGIDKARSVINSADKWAAQQDKALEKEFAKLFEEASMMGDPNAIAELEVKYEQRANAIRARYGELTEGANLVMQNEGWAIKPDQQLAKESQEPTILKRPAANSPAGSPAESTSQPLPSVASILNKHSGQRAPDEANPSNKPQTAKRRRPDLGRDTRLENDGGLDAYRNAQQSGRLAWLAKQHSAYAREVYDKLVEAGYQAEAQELESYLSSGPTLLASNRPPQ